VLEQAVVYSDEINLGVAHLDSRSDLIVAPVLGVVIIVALLVQRVGSTRAERDTSSSWRAAEEIRPVPRELHGVSEVRTVRWVGMAFLAIGALALPHFVGVRAKNEAAVVLIFGLICVSIVILTGWAGQVSLGQMGFVAVGGAISAVATQEWGLDVTLAMLLAGVAGAIVAVLVGLPALRLRGLYLAVTSLAFALATTRYLLNPSFFDWVPARAEGLDVPPLLGRWSLEDEMTMYYMVLAVLVLAMLGVRRIRETRTGRVLVAMRENEQGVQAYGVSLVRAKLTAFALSGFLAASAGALLVHQQRAFSLGLFEPSENLVVFTATVVGGLGSLLGGVVGALFLKGGEWWLPGEWRFLASAVGVLFVLLALPGGLSGALYRLRDGWLRSVARRNSIVVASLLADVRTETETTAAPTQQEIAEAFEREPAEEVTAP
jgi:branched-chain amino acid transport system permease protein